MAAILVIGLKSLTEECEGPIIKERRQSQGSWGRSPIPLLIAVRVAYGSYSRDRIDKSNRRIDRD